MSDHVDITIVCEDEPFNVRIFKDGKMEFQDYDFDYDMLMASMGDEETKAVHLFNRWQENPLAVILREPDLEGVEYENSIAIGTHIETKPNDRRNVKSQLVASFCAHHIAIHETGLRDFDRWIPGYVIAIIQAHSLGKQINDQQKANVLSHIRLMGNSYHDSSWPLALSRAARIAFGDDYLQVYDVAISASRAYANNAGSYSSDEFEKALEEEKSWQLRRFIDVVSAYQEGRPFPGVEETF